MEIIIDRRTWLRGEGSRKSYLLRTEDDKRCCLGFYAKECGLPDSQIQERVSLRSLFFTGSEIPNFNWLGANRRLYNDSKDPKRKRELHDLLTEANDDEVISEQQREERITNLFAQAGFTVRFIN